VPPASPVEERRNSESGNNSINSEDDYLQDCSIYGKYQIDKKSLVESKFRDKVYDERYGIPAIQSNNSSEDGIARWRSSDEEDDEDDENEPDWDMRLDRSMKIKIMPIEPDDDATMTSLEMIHFNPGQTKVLAPEHRVPAKSVSFQDIDVTDLPRTKRKPDRTKKEMRLGKRDHDMDSSDSGAPIGRRTISTISDSNSFSEEDDVEYLPKRRGLRLRKVIEEVEELEEPSITGGSSASYDEEMDYERMRQRQFRRADKARRRPLRPMQPVYYSDDDEEEDGNNIDFAVVDKKSLKREKKPKRGWLQKLFEGEQSEPLSWDGSKEEIPDKGGLFRRAITGVDHKQKQRSVQDLPFPKSESWDDSLVGLDKYQLAEVSQKNPMTIHPASRGNVSSFDELHTPDVSSPGDSPGERPVRQAKRGIGSKLKSLFL
jgi:hypothetical protein